MAILLAVRYHAQPHSPHYNVDIAHNSFARFYHFQFLHVRLQLLSLDNDLLEWWTVLVIVHSLYLPVIGQQSQYLSDASSTEQVAYNIVSHILVIVI